MFMVPWEEILNRLDAMGLALTDAAKSAVEFAYPLAYRQAVVEGVASAAEAVLCAITTYLCFLAIRKCLKKMSSMEEDWLVPAVFVSAVAGTFFAINIFFSIHSAIENLANPGWKALKHLVELLS